MQAIRDVETRLQPAKPSNYQLPPVVQPQWRLADLLTQQAEDEAEALRRELCESYGVRHCLLLDRARSGIYLLCKAFGLDGEWILTSLMHRPTAVVLQDQTAGVTFADVDEHLTIDPDSAARLIARKTSAILATHTYGKAADVVALRKLADQHGVALIENAVHMAGHCTVQGRTIGAWGDASVVSFNVDKPLGAILGGALLTNRDDIWAAVTSHALGAANTKEMRERIRTTFAAYRLKPLALRLPLGRRHRAAVDGVQEIEQFAIDTYDHYTPRHIHPRQARVALACLRRDAHTSEIRINNADRLQQKLRGDTRFVLPVSTVDRPHTYTYFPLILCEGSRMDLGNHLAAAGIETKWRLAPLHTQAGFTQSRRDDLSRSESLWRQHLLVPAGTSTNTAQIDRLADALLSWR